MKMHINGRQGIGQLNGRQSELLHCLAAVIENTEHRVSYARIVVTQKILVCRQTVHAPLLGSHVHIGINHIKNLLLCLIAETGIELYIPTELFPRLTVGVHKKFPVKFREYVHHIIAHCGGSSL